MIKIFEQDIRFPSPDKDTWSDNAVLPQRPMSPNFLESCSKELENSGLRLFDSYKYVEPATTDKTCMPRPQLSGNQHSGLSTNKRPPTTPIPCRGFFTHTRHHNSELTTSAEVHEYYLEPKPDFSRHTYVNISREQIDLHCNKKDDGEANHNCQATMASFESEGDNHIAQSDNRKPERPPSPSVHDAPPQKQYEDALSVYDVYIL